MSSDVILFCEQLKSIIGSKDSKKACNYIDAIDQYFNDRISENEIDLAVAKVFSEEGGVLGFVKHYLRTMSKDKPFQDATKKAFDLFVKIINIYPEKVKNFAEIVVIICLQYMRSVVPTAGEKNKAGAVIEALVLSKCCSSVDRTFLMNELLKIADVSNNSGTVASRMYGLIGCLAKDYPDCIVNVAEDGMKIRDIFFKALETVAVNKQCTTLVQLVGAFNGMNDFLEYFGPSAEHADVFARRLYKCIKKFSDPIDAKQKAVFVSALTLLSVRCELFRNQVFDDFFYWHNLLVNTWFKMDQFEHRRPAIFLLHAMHREIAICLLQRDDSDRCRQILDFLQSYFKSRLESSKSQPYEIRLAIVGFGLIAAPCKKLLAAEHLNELLRLVMQRTECAANAVSHSSKEQLEHFPDYVEALSLIMEQIDQLSGTQLSVLQNIVVSVIRNFHLLSTAHHLVTINTLMRTFHNLSLLGDSIVDDIIEKVVYQGIIWTCSHKLPVDAKHDWDVDTDWKDQVTYISYLPLWNGFLAECKSTSYDRAPIVCKIYDHMMNSMFKILNKLNLVVQKRVCRDDQGNELFFSDPNYDLQPECVKDFHIFFNLVGFFHDLLKGQSVDTHKSNFLRWINHFIEEVISKSEKYPLVSGFERLMQLILSIANRLDYFGNELYEDSQMNCNEISYYLTKTIQKSQQSYGELQIACLKLLFTSPTCMLRRLVHDMIPAFQIAFEIGKSNASLFIAGMALSTIERYLSTANRTSDETKEFLCAVLPYFDAYLQGFKNDLVKSVEVSRNRLQGTKRTAQKLIKVKENDLLKFQKRIILFLGTLEPEFCLYVMQNEYANLVKWNTSEIVRLDLYGDNINAQIYMDTLIPRICEIATSSTDRQKKMTACEIIQATILYLIGSSNHKSKLWSELCKLMLELGCDGDVGIRQMFEPLVNQTMHYMSRPDQQQSEGNKILLKCVMDAISHPSNLSVRDLASRSLREFLVWSHKQRESEEQSKGSPFNIDALIQQLKMFNSDALHQKRFGAALAFNNIYRELRKDSNNTTMYWLDFLHDFCVNFKLSEQQMEQNMNCPTDLDQVSASLDHVLRVLREQNQLFNVPFKYRVTTAAYTGPLLLHAVQWLLGQTNSSQNRYRKKVMEMFLALAPCVENFNSAAMFIRSTLNVDAVIELCDNKIDIEYFENRPFNALYTWLKKLRTSLDCYIWFIQNDFMPNQWNEIFEKSRIFRVLEHYIQHMLNKNQFADVHDKDFRSMEKINMEKSAIILLLLQFLNKTILINCVPGAIWQSNELIWMIESSVFRPQSLECDSKNPEFLSELPKLLKIFITNVNRSTVEQFKKNLNDKLVRSTTEIYTNLVQSIGNTMNRSSIPTCDTNNLKGVDLICNLIKSKDISCEKNLNENIDMLCSEVLYKIFDEIKERQGDDLIAKSLSPDVLKFTNHLLQLSFQKEQIHVNLIDLLLNTTNLITCDSLKSIKHGKHFLNLHKSSIYKYFLKSVDAIIERLILKILPPNVSYVLQILSELIEYVYKAGSKNIPQMKLLTNILLGNWHDIVARTDGHVENKTKLIDLMGKIAMICPYELTYISEKAMNFGNWLLNILNSDEESIETKCQTIFLLPCVIGPATNEHPEIQNALEKIQQNHFPLYTSELRAGSISWNTFENTFQTILDTMCASKSFVILKFVINCTAPDADHIMDQKIVQSIRKFMGGLKSEHQLYCMNKVFDMFYGLNFDAAIRTVLMERFLTHMILSSAKDVIAQFYGENIRKIETLLDSPYTLNMTDYKIEQVFTSRIGGFKLVEILIMVFERREICDKNFPALKARCGDNIKKGNELLVWMTSKADGTKRETFETTNAQHMEWFRKYQCAAYKALCSLISNTQTSNTFYDKLFSPNIWRYMINTSDDTLQLDQTLEVDKRPQIKERMVLIRRLKPSSDATVRNRRYIETQNVFESSLSQDVTKIDLSTSYLRSASEVENEIRVAQYQPKTLMLEQSSVNDHEIMSTVCGVVDHMFENDIITLSSRTWIDSINKIIAGSEFHFAIRIFLVTVIDNCSKWFHRYSDHITPSILKFLVDWTEKKRCIDALTIFLLVDILEWCEITSPINENNKIDMQNYATKLMANLMAYAYSPQREIVRRNLQLIRSLMEQWREIIEIPYDILYDSIKDSNLDSKVNVCGLHLNGIVIANDLVPWTTDESRKRFIKAILSCLNNHHSDVYQPAAQLLGMVLNLIIVKQNNSNIDEKMTELIDAIVQRLNSWRTNNEKKFMYILFYIDKYYVISNSEFITTITSMISIYTSEIRKFYLQMFLARVNDAENRDVEMVLLDLLNQSTEHQHQLIALHIFNKALSKLTIVQIKNIFPQIITFHDAKQAEIRDVLYEIMKHIRDEARFKDEKELKQKATEILLKGLKDVDKNLQITIFKYWDDLAEMPHTLNDRIIFMLRNLYNSDFLQNSVQLLINIKAIGLKRKIITSTLTVRDVDYSEYEVNVHWKSQDSTLRVPLFTESQQKQIMSGEFDPTQSYLRKKQHTLEFEPTLDPSTLYRVSSSFSLQSQSSLLLGEASQMLDRRSQPLQNEFGRTNEPKSEEERAAREKRNKFSYLRERILRNKDVSSRERALSAVRRRDNKEREESQQQKRKEGQVTLYRRYRFGDYPDFFIDSLAFLLPLQVLVKLDAILARNTFVSILNAVYAELDDEQQRTFSTELAESIENLIRQSNECDPMLFSALTEIAMTNRAKIKIEPGVVMPNANNMMINSILLLENSLMTARETKPDRYEEKINNSWAEMANIYYNLSEYDVASSIFAEKLDSDQHQRMAIEYESNGDYTHALHSYIQSIEERSEELADDSWEKLAQNFSYQSLFNCYEEMARWEDLEDKVNGQLRNDTNSQTNYEELWTDEWNTKYLLHYYVRSAVRTLIYNGPHAQTIREFLANIDHWLHHSTRAEFIKKNFGEQLMMLHVANRDYLEAKVFSNQYFESFLNEWSAMSVLSEKMRNKKLLNIRLVAEIHKYADLLDKTVDDDVGIDECVIATLADRWQQTQMNRTDSSQLWEALISYRIFVTEQALDKFPSKNAPIVGRLVESMFDMQFKLNEIAVQQQNTELSNTVLCRLGTFSQKYGQNTVKSIVQKELAMIQHQHIEWMLNIVNQNRSDSDEMENMNSNEHFKYLIHIWTQLRNLHDSQRVTLDANPNIRIKIFEQFNQITKNANDLLSKGEPVSEDAKEMVSQLAGRPLNASPDISEWISTFARQCCNETILLAEKCEENRSQMFSTQNSMKENDIGESYYRLAIVSWNRTNEGPKENQLEMQKLLIKSVLRGMRHGSKNARLQFPRLLLLKNINSRELTDLFNEEIKHVPVWNFLKWMTEIIAYFDFEQPCFLDCLLVQLANTYPTSVIYSFNLTYQEFCARKPHIATRPIVRQIQAAIKNPIIEKFIDQINFVSMPGKVLNYHLNNILKLKNNEEAVKHEFQRCYNNVYGDSRGKSSVYNLQQEFIALMGLKEKEEREKCINAFLKKVPDEQDRNQDLKIFSSWLKNYHWYGSNDQGNDSIEMPGQYTGNAPPNPSNILKIVKFHEKVQIFASLRRPIKITAICSDGKTYSFIVKYGEDLRQDERIQHIQELMSDQMKTNKNCIQQKLSLRTYKVIPLKIDYGIISFISNTDTINSLLTTDSSWRNKDHAIRIEYEKFIAKPKKADVNLQNNVQAVIHYSPEVFAQNMEKLQNNVAKNKLQEAIYNISASPECFYALRTNFTKSLATINIVHWLLGIGDRHLENFIIDMSNAQLIGIDFDAAFGYATRKQLVPELLPFRLTKQFVDVMQPMETSGFLEKCMSHLLRTFRNDSDSLMAALEIFIRDPSASNHTRGCKPEYLITTIKNKLNGINPTKPIENDLKIGYLRNHKDAIAAYITLLNGRPESYRRNAPDKGLSVEQQVKCLIDLATDTSVLGAAYYGFRPWV